MTKCRVQVVRDTARRAVVVGDIHGCLAELQHLLREVCFTNAATRALPSLLTAATIPPTLESPGAVSAADDLCVFVGDLVNKGPDSFGVVRLLRGIGAVGVLGNHDVKLVRLAGKLRSGEPLLPAEQTSSLLPLARVCPTDVWEYLHALPHALLLPQFSSLVVHAGADPTVPLTEQDPEALTRMRTLLKHDDYESMEAKHAKEPLVVLATSAKYVALEAGKQKHKWAAVWDKRVRKHGQKGGCLEEYAGMTAIFGHHAKASLQEYQHAIGLDTGCVYGRALTAVVLPERKLISVPGFSSDNVQSKV